MGGLAPPDVIAWIRVWAEKQTGVRNGK